ncbi:MAG: glycosyl hydrolase [Lewinellaceae bacterium]|nr:glycosyl hydrolase [Lewinellaceae bacterium]
MRKLPLLWLMVIGLLLLDPPPRVFAQSNTAATRLFNPVNFANLQWRFAGPLKGGRVNAVVGIPTQPFTYFLGSTGGGVWKTEDAGTTWVNISDRDFQSGTIGAIAIAPNDPNIIYVGTGEHAVRGTMTSHGDGVYRSTDGGQTWQHLGLVESRHIAAIAIHPSNPDIVYVAAQGAQYGRSTTRGVYRSTDGGRHWQQILYIDELTGACDLSLDPNNPRVLYAGMWDHQRQPWYMRSGGKGSGLYKSTDGGDNWEKLTNGLPRDLGKVGIAVSPARLGRIFAIVEAEEGGVYRSDDAGKSWVRTSADRSAIARAWYYTKIVPDPQDAETVYVLNAPLLRSIDGGKTFEAIPNPHTDQHALWINPQHPQWMILGNDGGAAISLNGGKTWSSQNNQPTAQIYRVQADGRFPYFIYGSQQDNSTIAIPNRSDADENGWYTVGESESAFIAFDNPQNPTLVFSSGYQGNISVFDTRTQTSKDIMAYPILGLAGEPRQQKFRFNWNAPLINDPHTKGVLYHGANVVLRSTDSGQSWQAISPDLTRNDPTKQGPGGGPFTNEGAGAEVYNTLSYLACSPQQSGEIWAGSDDGRLHLTHNGGESWLDITPPGLGEALINAIEVSPHQAGTAYIAATRHAFNDLQPLIYRTRDYGKSWTLQVKGIDADAFTRVVREDPKQPGLLYAGTERGFYFSPDAGDNWYALDLNLPPCPITDLLVHDNDLIAATAGRGLWILDDLGPLQQTQGFPNELTAALYQPHPAFRYVSGQLGPDPDAPAAELADEGQAAIDYYLPNNLPDSSLICLEIRDAEQQIVRRFSNRATDGCPIYEGGPPTNSLLSVRRGVNRFYWDLRRNTLPGVPKVFILGDYRGGAVAPGTYTVNLLINKQVTATASLTVLPDPRLEGTVDAADYQRQDRFLKDLEAQITDMHQSLNQMREMRDQMQSLMGFLEKQNSCQDLIETGKEAIARINTWEKVLIEPAQQTAQDVINFPNKLCAEFLDLKRRADSHDPRLSQGITQRADDLQTEWLTHKVLMQEILSREIASFNRIFKEKNIPALILPATSAF